MPVVIDLTTPEKMDAFGKAIASAAKGGSPVSLADVAEASETLRGPKVCYETDHYRIVDHGAGWKGRFTGRFAVERRPEFAKSRVMSVMPHLSNTSAESLLDSLENAEKFHMENLPHCGGF